jgi:FMN phosphatase YigB (HAD superfamily)/predicted kinase
MRELPRDLWTVSPIRVHTPARKCETASLGWWAFHGGPGRYPREMSRTTGHEKPRLIAVGGLVAVGKSSVSRALAERLGAVRFEADRVRDDLLREPDTGPVHEAHWWRAFESGVEGEIYRELLRRAEVQLSAGGTVVLDGCFARAHQRLEARALALTHGVGFLFVECRVPLEVSRLRLVARDAQRGGSGWQAIFDDLSERWESVSELASREHVVVRSEGAIDGVLAPIEARLSVVGSSGSPERRVVTFDCWNTLLTEMNWKFAHRLRVAELRLAAQEAGRAVSHEDARHAFDAAWSRHMELWRQGVATGAREVAQYGLAALGLDDPHPALEHLIRTFEDASHSSDVRALEGARETLAALERAGVSCALVCDTGLTPGRVVRRHLDREGLLGALAVQAFSDEVGAPKPDARAFAAALGPLGAEPERALHVGDLRRTDVAGARALGMTTVRIRQLYDDDPSPHPDADHVVDSHAELVALLEALDVL